MFWIDLLRSVFKAPLLGNKFFYIGVFSYLIHASIIKCIYFIFFRSPKETHLHSSYYLECWKDDYDYYTIFTQPVLFNYFSLLLELCYQLKENETDRAPTYKDNRKEEGRGIPHFIGELNWLSRFVWRMGGGYRMSEVKKNRTTSNEWFRNLQSNANTAKHLLSLLKSTSHQFSLRMQRSSESHVRAKYESEFFSHYG